MNQYLLKTRSFFAFYPEWWVWLFSITLWGFFLINGSCMHAASSLQSDNLILCLPHVETMGEALSRNILKQDSAWSVSIQQIYSGIVPWILMIFAMMFPLLKRSIRHVVFSVHRSNSDLGIILFLAGYTFVWALIGVVFLVLPQLIKTIASDQFPFYAVAGWMFFLAAYLSWQPSRRIVMMKCELTVPIRLNGLSFAVDTFAYGMKIGRACLKMCWIVMSGLVLINHQMLFMLVASAVILMERYFVPHESKLPGIAWMCVGTALFIIWIIG